MISTTVISDISDLYSVDSKTNYLEEAQNIAIKIFMEYLNSNAPHYVHLDSIIKENLFAKFGIFNIIDFSGKN